MNYTLGDRRLLFESAQAMVKALCSQLKKSERLDGLDENLLRDLIIAAMKAPGVAEREKVILARAVFQEGIHLILPQELHEIYRVSPFASEWPFEALGRKPDDVNDQVCEVSFFFFPFGYLYFKHNADEKNIVLLQCSC
jgi:hypothetical protein